MKKTLISLAAIMLVVTGFYSTAMAGQIAQTFTAGADDPAQPSTVYAQEMIDADLSTAVPGQEIIFEFTTPAEIPVPATAGYKLIYILPAGTTWATPNANVRLGAISATGTLTGNLPVITPAVTAGGFGQTRMELTFNAGAGAWAQFDDIRLFSFATGGIRVNNTSLATAGTVVNLRVEFRDIGNNLLASGSVDLMKSEYGFEFRTNTPEGGRNITINCASGRNDFTTGNDLAPAVLIQPSLLGGNVFQGDGVTPFVLAATDAYLIRLAGDFTGISRTWIDFDGDANVDAGETPTITGTAPTQVATWNTTQGAWNTGAARTLNIRVDGTTVLENRTFTIEADLNLADAAFNDHLLVPFMRLPTVVTPLGVVTAGTPEATVYNWAHNCYEATTPYMNRSATFNTFVKLFNDSDFPATVLVDITPDAGTGAITNYELGTGIPANSVGFYRASDIADAAGVSAEAFAMRFIVTAPANDVYGVVVQKSAAGDRVIPLYSNGRQY